MATRTYEIVTTEGRLRMEIDESWKVTYGPVSQGKGYGSENALRIYEDAAKERQRAVFTNVISFRDLSIPVQRLVIRERGKEKWSVDENGRRRISSTQYETKWVPEDQLEQVAGELESDGAPF